MFNYVLILIKKIAWYLVHNYFTLIGNVGYHACKFWKDTLKVGSFLKERKDIFQCKKSVFPTMSCITYFKFHDYNMYVYDCLFIKIIASSYMPFVEFLCINIKE